ncbi:toll/interleukin-1 receptor domain-containing protein [Variovorax sp. LjRoot175]|uniref:toll/interleukin-1 receptor domain-containing protein n=1 Tax=Variovorax sp. LjRoot175 TaxID=3342276 RepID=UPI003ECFD53E
MANIFISYSAKDEELAQFVRKHLEAHGLSVFLASISLNPGDRWTPRIVEELRASEWVCLLASKDALASANVQMEMGGAVFGNKKLVPIMWNVTPAELPRWVSDFQGLVLSGATIENVSLQVAELAAKIKADKLKGQLIAGAVLAGLIFFLGRS